MAYDMTNAILDAIVENLLDYVNEGINLGDPEYVETIEKGPLQDDPTLRATYLIVEADYKADPDGYRQPVGNMRKNHLHVPGTAPQWEIGGGFPMINYFKIGGWVPQSDTKSTIYENSGRFGRRLERSIQQMARVVFPAGVTTDDEEETTGGMLQVFNLNGTTFDLLGGDQEWYGKIWVKFAVYSKVNHRYWS